ncbi:MAG: transcription antitermination factor NusB [Spirochaetia bacterium]|jgi:N utilization substance protein B
MGARRKARIIAFQSLYRQDLSGACLEELLDFSWMDSEKSGDASPDTLAFARLLIQGALENLPRIDETIRGQLENWDFTRLNKVDLALLRMSVYCLLYQQDIPPTVTIDEAVDISKTYGTADSYRFVNGVLDGVRKKLLLPGS